MARKKTQLRHSRGSKRRCRRKRESLMRKVATFWVTRLPVSRKLLTSRKRPISRLYLLVRLLTWSVKPIHATGKPAIVVLVNGRPLSVGWIVNNIPAILESWMGGTQSGNAVADILFGDVNPGGKLPVTVPRTVGQVPIYYNHMNTGRPPEAQNRYTSKYFDVPWTPLFPFGFGLSYTKFRISNPQLSTARIDANGKLTVSVEVENVGRRVGDEVVQLYIRDPVASMTRSVKELKGFQRVTLQ